MSFVLNFRWLRILVSVLIIGMAWGCERTTRNDNCDEGGNFIPPSIILSLLDSETEQSYWDKLLFSGLVTDDDTYDGFVTPYYYSNGNKIRFTLNKHGYGEHVSNNDVFQRDPNDKWFQYETDALDTILLNYTYSCVDITDSLFLYYIPHKPACPEDLIDIEYKKFIHVGSRGDTLSIIENSNIIRIKVPCVL